MKVGIVSSRLGLLNFYINREFSSPRDEDINRISGFINIKPLREDSIQSLDSQSNTRRISLRGLIADVEYVESAKTQALLDKKESTANLELIFFGRFLYPTKDEKDKIPTHFICVKKERDGDFSVAFALEENINGLNIDLSSYKHGELEILGSMIEKPLPAQEDKPEILQEVIIDKKAEKDIIDLLINKRGFIRRDSHIVTETINALLDLNPNPTFWTKNRLKLLTRIDFRGYKDLNSLSQKMLTVAMKCDWLPAHRFIINPTVFVDIRPKAEPKLLRKIREPEIRNRISVPFVEYKNPFDEIAEKSWEELTKDSLKGFEIRSVDIEKIVNGIIQYQTNKIPDLNKDRIIEDLLSSTNFKNSLIKSIQVITIGTLKRQLSIDSSQRVPFIGRLLEDDDISTALGVNKSSKPKQSIERNGSNNHNGTHISGLKPSQPSHNTHNNGSGNGWQTMAKLYLDASTKNQVNIFEVFARLLEADMSSRISNDDFNLAKQLGFNSEIRDHAKTSLRFDQTLITYLKNQSRVLHTLRNPFADGLLKSSEIEKLLAN